MNDFFKRLLEQINKVWGKWSLIQKIIFFAIIGGVLGGLILLGTVSSTPSMVPLLNKSITDEKILSNITTRLEAEDVPYTVTADQRIMVDNERIARQMRAILVREDLIPSGTDPWELFDVERWTITDFERNVNLRRALTTNLQQHITALEDVDAADVTLVMPETELFAEDQDPVTASIIITPKPGSDFTENRKKIEGVVRLIQYAVEGLTEEYITITDHRGIVLNNFDEWSEIDRLELARREMKTKTELENQYKKSILRSLQSIYTKDRVEIINLDISLDMGRKTVETEEHFPITMVEDNPRTPFSETEVIESITLSKETLEEKYEGTGFNPEGPPGQEGQTPPAYKDLEGLVGSYTRNSTIQNEVVNKRTQFEEKSPWEITRISVAVAIDGTWKKEYDENGKLVVERDGSVVRAYSPVDEADLIKAQDLVEHAIGYNRDRGDAVTVQHMSFDRTAQFAIEDAELLRQQQLQTTIIYILIGLAFLLVSFIAFRLISREIERRRRLREEELARQHQAMREAALRSAEEESTEVEMSVEERARLEMQENAINMAREHPEDVAQLIRTWLMEE